jgi:hypothetical protein
MKRIVLLPLACILMVACQADQRSVTGVRPPSGLLMDGAHNSGNTHFFFLPPLVPQPSVSGVFNSKLQPVVVICELTVDANNIPVGCSGAAPIDPGPVTADLAGQQYNVNWNTGQPAIDPAKFYRIQVFGSRNGLLLGFADVDPVNNGSQLKNVNTGQYIGLVDGRTLPIKFRIERGAFGTNCVSDCAEASVPGTGGTVITNTGFAGALFPNDWIRPDVLKRLGIQNVVVTIERVNLEEFDGPCVPRNLPQAEGCYRFRTSPDVGLFNTDVTVGICVEVPEGNREHDAAQLFSVEEGGESETITPLANASAPFVTCEGFASARSRGVLQYLASWLTPSAAYAAHVGAGGLTGSFSRIGWVLPTAIDFDTDPSSTEGVAPGSIVDNTYSSVGVTFRRAPSEGSNTCGADDHVYANNNGGSFASNAVSLCSGTFAADFSENSQGRIEADFGAPVSTVCVHVDPTGFQPGSQPGATGFLEAFDAEGVSLGKTTSLPDVPQDICFQSARGVEISHVQFAGTGDGFAVFDDLAVTFIEPPTFVE